MITIKSTTKRGQELLQRANVYVGTTLREAYGRFSTAKERAYDHCRMLCAMEQGQNFHICGKNTSCFTVAWETAKGWRLETKDNSYLII